MTTDTRAPDPALVEITIDGRRYQAPKGANLLQFMLEQGIEISSFCYHPGLSIVAVCRQCLVELKSSPKLVPACQTSIAEGMEVGNSSPRVLEARRQILEFTLVNHPIDCPICDKAGECILQRHYMGWDHGPSRVDHPKVRKPKRVAIGPRIVLDDERCILCTRCVRFMSEVVKAPQLTIAKRGAKSVLTTAPGKQLDHPYSLNTVDICPVGALTDRDFRFKIRVWQLSATPSICTGCATGCWVEIHHHRSRIHRLVPRRFHDINLNWMCDHGRSTYRGITEGRALQPRFKGVTLSWDDALGRVGERLGALIPAERQTIDIALGAYATNEDNFIAARLAFDFLDAPHVYLAAEDEGPHGDTFLRTADPNPNRAGALACGRGKVRSAVDLAADLAAGKLKALYVVGDKLTLPPEALDAAERLQLFAVQATRSSPLVERAHVMLPAAMWAEVDGTMTNREKVTQRLRAAVPPAGSARPHWQILVQVARRAGLTLECAGPRAAFEALRQEIDLFREAQWGPEIGPMLLRFAGSRG